MTAEVHGPNEAGGGRHRHVAYDMAAAPNRYAPPKVGFIETEPKEVHPVYGTTLFTTRRL